jgi:hypothetical protein
MSTGAGAGGCRGGQPGSHPWASPRKDCRRQPRTAASLTAGLKTLGPTPKLEVTIGETGMARNSKRAKAIAFARGFQPWPGRTARGQRVLRRASCSRTAPPALRAVPRRAPRVAPRRSRRRPRAPRAWQPGSAWSGASGATRPSTSHRGSASPSSYSASRSGQSGVWCTVTSPGTGAVPSGSASRPSWRPGHTSGTTSDAVAEPLSGRRHRPARRRCRLRSPVTRWPEQPGQVRAPATARPRPRR